MAADASIGMCESCPDCGLTPRSWIERAKFGSRELYWIGCKAHSHMTGGVTRGAAIMSWNRLAVKIRYDRNQPSDLKRKIG